MDVLSYFPHSEFRKYQKEAILDIIKDPSEYFILEAPTGFGKSALAICLGLFYQKTFLLTSQKILQEQYMSDYGSSDTCVIKGRSNYPCVYYDDGSMCNECGLKKCPMKSDCVYEVAKVTAKNARIALMNYSYFLHSMEYTGFFGNRNFLICDETHNLENELMKFTEFNFSTLYLSRLGLTSKIPEYQQVNDYIDWLRNIYSKICDALERNKSDLELYSSQIELNPSNVDKTVRTAATKLEQENEQLTSLQEKINRFYQSYDKTEWVFDFAESKKLKAKTITFKPLKISFFTADSIFKYANKKLLMSATILDKKNLCNSLGIDESKAKFLRIDSSFPNESRPIIMTHTGSMNLATIDNTLPKIAQDVKKIIDYHHDEKGLIHTHTYKISNYIRDNLKDDRFIFHTSEDREQSLTNFLKATTPKILVTPSMTEGIDLKDDLARFVIVIKIPYLFLGDKQIKRRMEIDEEWYRWKAALTLVQASGRAMRHADDYCTIYIMDSGINYFIKQNRNYFPKYFIDSIKN